METVLASTCIQYEGGTTGILQVDIAIVIDIPGEFQGLLIGNISLIITNLIYLHTTSTQGIALVSALIEYHIGIKLIIAS